ncbi:MAG: hypothetical protein M1822_002802 [Bathelium mastoideum]|nr:MAG: hypothetical protein M1822_002802 [Bathelium mastoideum]
MTRFTPSSLLAFCAALSFLPTSQAGFGAFFNLQNSQQSGPYITYAITTLEIPDAPSPQVQTLVLWPGLYTGNDLIQSIAASFDDPSRSSETLQGCNGQSGQWCAFASELPQGAPHNNYGSLVALSKGDMLTIEYRLETSNNSWIQSVTHNGDLISQYVSANAQQAYRWTPSVECQDDAEGKMTPAHTYHNSKLVLSDPDPTFVHSLSMNAASNDGVTSPDGGKTWEVNTISLQAAMCPEPNTSQRR